MEGGVFHSRFPEIGIVVGGGTVRKFIRGDFINPNPPYTIYWNGPPEFWRARLPGTILRMRITVDAVFRRGLHTVHISIPFETHHPNGTRSSAPSTTSELVTSRIMNIGQKQRRNRQRRTKSTANSLLPNALLGNRLRGLPSL